jgi:hypothetical protein
LKDGSYGPLRAATEQDLECKIRGVCVMAAGPERPDELSALMFRFPRYWIRPVREGYLAVPRGFYPIAAATIEELEKRLRLSR